MNKVQKNNPSPSVSPWPLWHAIAASAVLLAATLATYYYGLNYEFQFDDIANITKHFNIRSYTLSKLFFSGTRWISYLLNAIHYSIGGFNPLSYRVGNLIIHSCNGLLAFFLLLLGLSNLKKESFFKTNAFVVAFTTALLFLLHPVQTQTVSYVIQGELEGMATLATLSMALCFLLITRTAIGLHRTILTGMLVGIGLLACGTKEIAIICPVLILLFDWFFVAQGSASDLKKRVWIHLLVAITIFGGYLYLLKPKFFLDIFGFQLKAQNNIGNVITSNPTDSISPFHFFISQFKVILHYITIFIWPFGICVEYDWVLSRHFFALDCIIPLAILIGIGVALYKLMRTYPAHPIAFGALWFFLGILPRASIVPSCELMVDYKTYISSMGILFVLACALIGLLQYVHRFYAYKQQIVQPIALCLVACSLGYATIERNKVWHSGIEFWGNVIQNAPGKARAWNNYGVEVSQNLGQYTQAIPYFQKAIAMDSHYPDPHNNIAVCYASNNEIDKAIEAIKNGLRINKFHAEGYNNLAAFLLQKRDYVQAEKELKNALAIRPHYGKAYLNLGRLHMETGNELKAWECLKTACTKADLDNEMGYMAFGRMSLQIKKYDDAVWAFAKLVEQQPTHFDGLFNLANAHYMAEHPERAIPLYNKIAQMSPQDARIWYNLGESHYGLHEYSKALPCFEKVCHMQSAPVQCSLRIAECHAHLKQFDQSRAIIAQLEQKDLPAHIKLSCQALSKQLAQNTILG